VERNVEFCNKCELITTSLVTGLRFDKAIEFLSVYVIGPAALDSGVYSAS
jgi:hypothetical protein